MSYTYLEFTNLALREVNEVPLTQQQFVNARGLQQYAKETITRSFYDISGASREWPWLQNQVINTANVEVRKLPAGQAWHDIEPLTTGIKISVDWDSFLLTEKDLESVDPAVVASTPEIVRRLEMVTYENWLKNLRIQDFSQENNGTPRFVVRSPSGKFGLSPVPDVDYWVEFNSLNSAVRFTDPLEEIPFPEEFANVLVSRCSYYLWKFRENYDQAKASDSEYTLGLKNMKRVLLSNKQDRIRAV